MPTSARRATIITAGIATAIAAGVAIAIGLAAASTDRTTTSTTSSTGTTAAPVVVLRDDTHLLTDAGPDAPVLVEFLDFECEACGAFFPVVEDLTERYGDRVTFAFRYFPLPSHGNSVNAALAVEAAARQGALEAMFTRMFETQAQWGERGSESQASVFRGYAEELGLDLAQYDADIADPAVLARIQADVDDGVALGIGSTPTFFLDGVALQLQAYSDVEAAIVAALNAR